MKRFLPLALTLALAACSAGSDVAINDLSTFVEHLRDAGYDVASDPSPSDKLFPFMESRLLVEGAPLQMYTFGTPEEAAYGAKLIAADGSKVDQVPVKEQNPVFYRKDHLIVVYTQEEEDVNEYLRTVLGDPVYPKPAGAASSTASTASSDASTDTSAAASSAAPGGIW